MNKFNIKVIALSIGIACSTGAIAGGLTEIEYKTEQDKITANYTAAMNGCALLAGNASEICKVDATGKNNVTTAELDARDKQTRKSRYLVDVAKADADYAVTKQRCNDLVNNAKDVCVKEAQSAQVAAKADAKEKRQVSIADTGANVKSAKAQDKAIDQTTDAKKEAATDKRNAEYAVAKEKCDVYAGSTKDNCLSQAKTTFAQ